MRLVGDAEQEEQKKKPKSRRWWVAAAIISAVLIMTWAVLRDSAPVGHFISAAGHDRYMAAYEKAMRELPPPDATLDLRTGYGIVRVYRFDGADRAAAPIVLLSGKAAASPMWADNVPSLRRLRTVYTVDLLGEAGASVQQRPIETNADQARWLHETLMLLPEPAVHVFGVSIGGWVAMNLAIHHPQKLAGVILLDPAVTFSDMSWQAVVRSIPVAVKWAPRSWRDGFNSWTANGAPVENVPTADMIEAGMQTYSAELPAPQRFAEARLAALRVPVLAVMAGKSVMHDSAAAAAFAREALPRATVLVYENASHAVNGEQPDRIAGDVSRFIGGIG